MNIPKFLCCLDCSYLQIYSYCNIVFLINIIFTFSFAIGVLEQLFVSLFLREKGQCIKLFRYNFTSLTELRIPNETMWLVAKSSDIPCLDWSKNLSNIQHFDLENSSIRYVTDEFFSRIQTLMKAKFLNLANNYLKSFPKTLNGTSFSKVYLAGNPINCNCDMLWFAHWLNATAPQSQNRIVRDYKRVLCVGGKWNGTQVYNLSPVRMGCFPKNIPR